jgi:hypothetical protein
LSDGEMYSVSVEDDEAVVVAVFDCTPLRMNGVSMVVFRYRRTRMMAKLEICDRYMTEKRMSGRVHLVIHRRASMRAR